MDVREEKEKLKALNLLNCMIEVDICGTKIRGQVYYFNQKALILRRQKEYIFINICKYEEMNLKVISQQNKTTLKQDINNEVVRPSQLLAAILD